VVIALAARNLPARQQTSAVFLGSAAAIVLRVILTLFAVQLLQLPYLKLAGGLLLIWIGAKMLVDEEGDDSEIAGSDTLIAAVGTILFADLVMSVDNVIAVAAAARNRSPPARLLLLIIGLGLSIPLIIIGAQLLMETDDTLADHHHAGCSPAWLCRRPKWRSPIRCRAGAGTPPARRVRLLVLSRMLHAAQH